MKPIDGYFLITPDLSLIYPVDPKQRTKELDGVEWPPTEAVGQEAEATNVAAVDFAKFAHEWIADWNGHDLERILAHYCDDVELISPFVVKLTGKTEGVIRGKPALRDYFARGVEAFPTLRFEFVRHYSGVRSCRSEEHTPEPQSRGLI